MFLIKKLITPFLMPLSFCLLLAGLGLLLLWFTRRERLGKVLVTAPVLLLLLFSSKPAADRLLGPLENRYPPLPPETIQNNGIEFIVVLGSGLVSDPRLPATGQLDPASLGRLVEAIRLQRQLPGSKLLLSGGPVFDPIPVAVVMAQAAAALGVLQEKIILEVQSRDTEEEARIIKAMVANQPFVLVTSASHLARAMALFEHQGMRPIPAPAHHLVKERNAWHPGDFFPKSGNLHKANRAIHEYLGLLWSSLRGQT